MTTAHYLLLFPLLKLVVLSLIDSERKWVISLNRSIMFHLPQEKEKVKMLWFIIEDFAVILVELH